MITLHLVTFFLPKSEHAKDFLAEIDKDLKYEGSFRKVSSAATSYSYLVTLYMQYDREFVHSLLYQHYSRNAGRHIFILEEIDEDFDPIDRVSILGDVDDHPFKMTLINNF